MPFDGTNYKTNTVADTLRRARALIDSPEKWGQRGDGLRLEGPRRCIILAIGAADPNGKARGLLTMSRALGPSVMMHHFNDTHSHADVMAAFDRAIALAEQE